MARPLYRLPAGVSCEPKGDGHRGLWYDKFCDRWTTGWDLKSAGGNLNPKLAWIEKATNGKVGSETALADYAERLYNLVTRRGGAVLVGVAQSRFVTGLGRSHPTENGFAWHPTLGTPYLPGSSLKGLTKAWAREAGYGEEADRVLGGPGQAGTVAFLDAVPVRPVDLEADVLTPHYANWTKDDPPGDWRSPIPVPYLVAASGTSLLFGLIPAGQAGGDDVALARQWLVAALDEFGVGAKTAIGYGRFLVQPDPLLERLEREREEREAMSSPEGRWRLRLRGRTEQELVDTARKNLLSSPLEDPEELRGFIRVILETGKVSAWRRGEKTDPRTSTGDRKLKELARAVRAAAIELGVELPQ